MKEALLACTREVSTHLISGKAQVQDSPLWYLPSSQYFEAMSSN